MPDDPTPTVIPAGNTADLPQWARDAITKANNEAATFRTQLRAKTDEHTTVLGQAATVAEEKATAVASASAAQSELMKLQIALAAGIPGDKAAAFAARLQGTTEAELKADAEVAKGLYNPGAAPANPPATDPSQGRGNADFGGPVDNATALGFIIKSQLDKTLGI